jgi:nitroreductase
MRAIHGGVSLDMPLREAMETQRSIRRLKPDPVDDEVLLRCIELATRAPSGAGRRAWARR